MIAHKTCATGPSWYSLLSNRVSLARFPQFFWEAIVGFDSQTPHHPARSRLVCKEKWVAPLQAVCRLPRRRSEYPLLTPRLRHSPFAKDGWDSPTLTKLGKTSTRTVSRTCYEIPCVTQWSKVRHNWVSIFYVHRYLKRFLLKDYFKILTDYFVSSIYATTSFWMLHIPKWRTSTSNSWCDFLQAGSIL